MKYLTLARGPTPAEAEAVFVSDDQDLIELVVTCLIRRLEERPGELENAYARGVPTKRLSA